MIKKFLALTLCAGLLLTTTSCLKKQNLDDDDLGAPIAPMELTKALGSGYGSYDYNEIKANEFTSIMVSQRIQDSVTQNLQQQGITVKQVANTVDKLSLDLIVQAEDYTGGQTTQASKEWPIDIEKSAANTTQAKSIRSSADDPTSPILMFLTFQQLAFGFCYDSGENPETCHKLTAQDIQYQVPYAAANEQHCVDPTNCTIPAKKIEFDRIQKTQLDKDGKPRRTHFTVVLSPNVPFMSRVLQLCTRGLYTITNSQQKIVADVCYTVNNYASGH